MTILYLHGGNTSFKTKENKKFYEELCQNAKSKKILLIPFAQNKENWNINILDEKINKFFIKGNYKIKLASNNKIKLFF